MTELKNIKAEKQEANKTNELGLTENQLLKLEICKLVLPYYKSDIQTLKRTVTLIKDFVKENV